ncbi:MAG: peptidoglycan-binding protein, partial [Gammaproteobacteria bacterium]
MSSRKQDSHEPASVRLREFAPRAIAWPVLALSCMLFGPNATASQFGVDLGAHSIEQRLTSVAAQAYPYASEVSQFYAERNFEPVWMADPSKAKQLIDALRDAASEGLSSVDYGPDLLELRLTKNAPEEGAALELALTDALLRYVADLRGVQSESSQRELRAEAVLANASAARDLRSYLKSQGPANPMYRRLRRMLAQYRGIEARGGWPMLLTRETLKPGASAPEVAVLRRRLEASGDITVPVSEPEHFDQGLEMAVQRYQKRVGLEQDGVVGPKTRAALNVPVAARVEQIRINLERWRAMPDDLGERYVLV